MDASQAIGTITSYDDLILVARQRMDQLEITFETLDAISGVQPGYSAKLLCPGHCKTFGPISFCAVMGALSMKLIAVEDLEALSRVPISPGQAQVSAQSPCRLRSMRLRPSPDNRASAQQLAPAATAESPRGILAPTLYMHGSRLVLGRDYLSSRPGETRARPMPARGAKRPGHPYAGPSEPIAAVNSTCPPPTRRWRRKVERRSIQNWRHLGSDQRAL